MLVPEGGRGKVLQVSVTTRSVNLAVGTVGSLATLLVLAAIVQAATFSRVTAHPRLVGENLELKARLDQVDRQLTDLDELVQRVRVYDDKLRDLSAREALPGFGPLDLDEARARQDWIDGVVRVPTKKLRSEDLQTRATDIAAEFRAVEPGLVLLDERLAQIEAMRDGLPVIWPVDGTLTSNFGYRRSPFGHQWKFHTGIDIGAVYGSPIVATNGGLVVFSEWDSGHGRTVEVDHGNGVSSRYCHASRLLVSAGDVVEAGEALALVGSTGMSTGPHLHYELLVEGEKVDPLEYLP